jgi:hypothetical protein
MRDNLYILTKIHSLVEAKSKVEVLRKNDIIIPMMIVPPHVRKSSIYVPDESCILVDDSKKNVVDWVENGGTGLLFDKGLEEDEKEKVKSLHFLLKG